MFISISVYLKYFAEYLYSYILKRLYCNITRNIHVLIIHCTRGKTSCVFFHLSLTRDGCISDTAVPIRCMGPLVWNCVSKPNRICQMVSWKILFLSKSLTYRSLIVTCLGVRSSNDGSLFITGDTKAIVNFPWPWYTIGPGGREIGHGGDVQTWRTLLVLLTVQLGTQLFCMVHIYMTVPVLYA